jgi:predicted transcriptional regulator
MESIREILKGRDIFTVQSDSTVKETVSKLANRGVGLVPVMKDDKIGRASCRERV